MVESNSQPYIYEDFGSKSSLSNWKIFTNGNISIQSKYFYRGSEFDTKSDSFLSITENPSSDMFSASISRKFKFVPGRNLRIRFKLITNDTLYDLLYYSVKVLSQAKKTLMSYQHYITCNSKYPNEILLAGLMLGVPGDSISTYGDSMEINFRFASNANNKLQARNLVFNDIDLDKVYASNSYYIQNTFVLYPNPCIFGFNIVSKNYLSNAKITITDITGRVVKQISNCNGYNLKIPFDNADDGVYNVKVFNSSQSSFQKILKISD